MQQMMVYLERVGRLRVQVADSGVQPLPVRGTHHRLVQGTPEGVEGDVDGTAIGACFLQFLSAG